MMHLKQWAPFSQYKCMNLEFFSDFETVCLNCSHFTFEPHTHVLQEMKPITCLQPALIEIK